MGNIPTRTFSNDLTEIEVGGHTDDMRSGDIIDLLHIALLVEGDQKAADALFAEVEAKYLNRPLQRWLDG
jgi:hypothetical protein